MGTRRRTSGILGALVILGAAAAAYGVDPPSIQPAQHRKANSYKSTILVSNEEDEAPVVDPLLVNAWGIAASSTGPWWVANNGTSTSTVYKGDGTKIDLEVKIPGVPTGVIFNGGNSFQLTEGAPALFIFVSEEGTFSAWNSGNEATAVLRDPESVYKGLAIHGDVLYTTDFASCEVEAYHGNFFDKSFAEFDTAGGFEDDSIPSGYCPFGIQAVGDSIFVTYAKKDGIDDVPGIGHGFVREFDTDGNLVSHVASHGFLNSPWGLAMAPPEGFGKFGGCLLVGNFGNGKINAYCQNNNGEWHHGGRLREGKHPLAIDGLWGIGFGNDGLAGPSNVLYFSAGPDEEENGYYGTVEFDDRRCP